MASRDGFPNPFADKCVLIRLVGEDGPANNKYVVIRLVVFLTGRLVRVIPSHISYSVIYMSDQQPTGRIRPLARRLDSLSGSPTSGPRPGMPIRPRAGGVELVSASVKVAPKPFKEKPESDVKQEHVGTGVGDLSVRDVLAQARRREAESQARAETTAAPRGAVRKQVIRTDIQSSETSQRMVEAFMAETNDDIDLEGDDHYGVATETSNRCYPVKVPFHQAELAGLTPRQENLITPDDLILFQLPSLFPTLVPKQHEADLLAAESAPQGTPRKRGVKVSPPGSPKHKPAQQRAVGTPFVNIPDGRIGVMKTYKSGKTVLEVGETQFIVSQGQQVNFRTEVACLCPGEGEIIFLGQAYKRVVVSPVII